MKKIYRINLDNDLGTIWFDENRQPLDYVHSNDADFRDEYLGFIIEYLGGELIDVELKELPEKAGDRLCEECGDLESMMKILKKYIVWPS